MSLEPFSCFLIGEGTMPIRCAGMLLERNHAIRGIISPDPAARAWAVQHGIAAFAENDDWERALQSQPFDYLFSIVNRLVLAAEVLAMPRRGAVNYHDAPLPRYAGTQATSWALIHQETEHGITWHRMAELVDAGDVLKQVPVPIQPDDTALTLNARCYDAALEAFAELLDELAEGRAGATPQDLSRRTYFGLRDRPEAAALLRWERPAAELDALVRGLELGHYPNPLGRAKVRAPQGYFAVTGSRVVGGDEYETQSLPPGSVVEASAERLVLATGEGLLELSGLATLEGRRVRPDEIVAGLPGNRLPLIGEEEASRITALNADLCRSERFWIGRLADVAPAAVPLRSPTGEDSDPLRVGARIPPDAEALLKANPRWDRGTLIAAAAAAYILRLGREEPFDLGLRTRQLAAATAGLEGLFAPAVPIRIPGDDSLTFPQLYGIVHQEMEAVRGRGTWIRDLPAREPGLRSRDELRHGALFPILLSEGGAEAGENDSGAELVVHLPGPDHDWELEARGGRLSPDELQRVAHHLETLLASAARDTGQPVSSLSVLTDSETAAIRSWNDTGPPFPFAGCVHELIEEHARRTPDALAVWSDHQTLSYAELNARANRIAHCLRSHGIGPERMVAVCLERSPDLLAALLGVLKSGGAYVPLDPTYPVERLAFMLKDARAPVVLSQEGLRGRLADGSSRIICLDSDGAELAAFPRTDPPRVSRPEHLAYTIFTSGSTGQPKGVEIEHAALLNLVGWHLEEFDVRQADRATQMAGPAFDACGWEVWPYLAAGASVGIVDDVTRATPERLRDWLVENRITLSFLPTPLAEQVLGLEWPEAVALRALLTGGDRLQRHPRALPFRLINNYGPTENTVVSTSGEVPQEPARPYGPSIGRPIRNTEARVLTPAGRPVPIGAAGELCVSGASLARGYLNRPDLTSERFVSIPENEPGARMYRTGDLVRWAADGTLEFLGRIDHQVKVRGFRIELGEVESALGEHPSVREAVVTAREELPGEKRLVAYLVPASGETVDQGDLRSHLEQRLPQYMLPAAFVFLDAFPLTSNGKIDRGRLPAPGPVASANGRVPPRDDLEKWLIDLWERVLEVSPIGVSDDFFDLGGHSLLAIRVFNEVEERCGWRIPLATLFNAPTIEQLAAVIRSGKQQDGWSSIVPIRRQGTKPPLFCLHAAGGNVVFYRDLAIRLGADQPVYGIQPQGLDGSRPRHRRMDEMAAYYLQEIRTVQPQGPYYLCGSSFGGSVAFEMALQLRDRGEEVGILAVFDTGGPGYPQRLPKLSRLRRLAYRVMDAVARMADSLRRLDPEGRRWYCREQVWRVRKRMRRFFWMRRVDLQNSIKKSGEEPVPVPERETRRSIQQCLDSFVPRPYGGVLTLFRATHQPKGIVPDPNLGWADLAQGGIELHEIEGHHGSIVREPYVEELALKLEECLARARSRYER